jgi:hypothetical protein
MYNWEGMKKINLEEALERYKNNKSVYVLYDDGTESEIGWENAEKEMKIHANYGGEFGYEL